MDGWLSGVKDCLQQLKMRESEKERKKEKSKERKKEKIIIAYCIIVTMCLMQKKKLNSF